MSLGNLWRHARTVTPWFSVVALLILLQMPIYDLPWWQRVPTAVGMAMLFTRVFIRIMP